MKNPTRKIFIVAIALTMLLNPVLTGMPAYADTSTNVKIAVEGTTDTILAETEIAAEPSNDQLTALDALEQVLDAEDIEYELEHYDWGGTMVTSIDGEASGTFGGFDGWMFNVNGQSPEVGADAYILEPEDDVLFYYSRWADISTESLIEDGDEDPSVTVNIVGDEYLADSADPDNWEIDTAETGLAVDDITKEDDQQVTITFTGTASTGIISITAKAPALGGDADSDEITINVIVLGDVSGNGTINVGDAIKVLRHIASIEELNEDETVRADVNRDGVVNIIDAILILRHVVNLIDEFPDESPVAVSEIIDEAIEETVAWYNQKHIAPNSWEGLPALWGAGEDLNNDPWETGQEWRSTDPGFEADDEDNNHPQYIFRLLAVQQNPADVWDGRNLFAELSAQQAENGSFGDLGKQIWSIVALDAGKEMGADVGNWDADSRQNAVDYLITQQNDDGSFGAFSELDFTGWALIALSGYTHDSDVEEAINDAAEFLKSRQQETAGFAMEGEWGEENANSNASVITGLVAIGEDLLNPAGEWVENGNTILDALLKYQQEDGSFWYTEEMEGMKKMSTVQCLLALVDLKNEKSTWQRLGEEILSATLAVEGINETVLQATDALMVSAEDNATALDLLEQVLTAEEIDHELEHYDWGTMITNIDGEAGGTFGGWDGWMFKVNGQSPEVGADAYILEPGDEVLFYYSRSASISTESSVEAGDEDPSITVDLVGDEYLADAADLDNWEINTAETGLVVDDITKEGDQQVTITFTGTAEAGTISITAKAAALGGDADSNEITLNLN